MTVRPLIVQHSFGAPGSGGPIAVVESILNSDLSNTFEFVRMHQDRATGGIDFERIREWAGFLKAVEPSIVHVQGLGNEGFHAAAAAKLAGCQRVVVSIHGTVRDLTEVRSASQVVISRFLEPATLSSASVIVPLCDAMASRRYLARHRRKMAHPIPNGVDVPARPTHLTRVCARQALGFNDDEVVAVVVGRVTFEKGHGELAEAIGLLRRDVRERLRLLVVGSGKDFEAVRRRYQPFADMVKLLGHRSDVDDLLLASDIFVFPSRHENVSMALLEAMARELPVIATDVGGNPEVLRGGGGVLVPPRSPAALATALEGLVLSPDVRAVLGSQARTNVESHFSAEQMTQSWGHEYMRMLGTTTCV